ncbi:ANTAR domain-containing response regulator [Pseudomonas aeruginosa]|uniref:ANTAR domain-containing response regulator n=1 Tax=Pseudomonas aeruginosa group TaxID=136841 RepID=UPI001FD270F6|nr:ANTAR domain-containing protein [Pseudomonas aeruginosa]MCR3763754.1 ANTAR domain-containing protein [Pseudomonas aeruginosa]HBP5566647.1 ANTAR domain-containing protein [Pseudomonas aeruginosa]HCF2414053.1 ANTAR domain-containing protein [Pseudomonas aeruginosa]
MSASSLLGSLRELQVLVLHPPGEVSDALVLQLIRIGCSVRQCWPPPEAFEVPVDVVFSGIFQNRHHDQLASLLAAGDPRITLVALVEYESPAVLSQIIELECHGVITQPLDAHRVLPVLVSARRVSEALARLQQKNAQLQERIAGQARIGQAKALLMQRHGWGEREAHLYLSREAMKRREPILKIAQELLGNEPSA